MSETLSSILSAAQIRLSSDARHAIAIASAIQRSEFKSGLSRSSLFAGCCYASSAVMGRVMEFTRSSVSDFESAFYSSSVAADTESDETVEAVFDDLALALKALQPKHYTPPEFSEHPTNRLVHRTVDARELASALLLSPSVGSFARRLERIGISADRARALASNLADRTEELSADVVATASASAEAEVRRSPRVLGPRIDVTRHYKGSPLLEAEELAADLAAVFARAEGEFCFGIFGSWGRGKTYLSGLIEERLLMREHPSYRAVRFSAWRYPVPPSCWVQLFETMYRTFAADQRSRGPLRYLLVAAPRWVLVIALALPVLVLLYSLDIVTGPMPAAFALITGFVLSADRLMISMGRMLASITPRQRHREHLGIQSELSSRLRLLLDSWVLAPSIELRLERISLWLLAMAVLVLPVLPHVDFLSRWLPNLSVAAAGAVCTVYFLGSMAVLWSMGGNVPTRLLLTIDDLDRCSPDAMVELSSSLRLLLEESSFGDRMQVLFLLDEQIFREAVRCVYGQAGGATKVGQSLESRVEEHIEKLLIAYLRLPPLTEHDISQLFHAFSQEGLEDDGSEAAAEAGGLGFEVTRLTDPEIEVESDAAPRAINETALNSTKWELPAFRKGFVQTVRANLNPTLRGELTPRRIRSMIIRYKIVRRILKSLDVRFDPDSLGSYVAARALNVHGPASENDDDWMHIVDLVFQPAAEAPIVDRLGSSC